MFRNAIARLPCPAIKYGLTSAQLGTPDFDLAVKQHKQYTDTLRDLGLNVRIL